MPLSALFTEKVFNKALWLDMVVCLFAHLETITKL